MNSWVISLKAYIKPNLLIILPLGLLAGIPYGMIVDPLNYWLSKSGVDRASIGLLSLVFLTYSVKALWAPLVDRLRIPLLKNLGQRKSWLIVSQFFAFLFLISIGFNDPIVNLSLLVFCVFALAFFSATQDICLDALRIELVKKEELGQSAAIYQLGWRVGGVYISQVLGLLLGGMIGYSLAYLTVAFIFLGLSVFVFFRMEEPTREVRPYLSIYSEPRRWLKDSFVDPFIDLKERYSSGLTLLLLLLFFYRLSDMYLAPMAMPFYREIGFTETEVALVTNAFGSIVTIAGVFIGGLLVHRWGLEINIFYGALLTCLTNLPFIYLNYLGNDLDPSNDLPFLWVTIGLDNLNQGYIGTVAITFISRIVSQSYTATQYAILFLLGTVPSRFIASSSGFLVNDFGYHYFFLITACLGIPAIIISYIVWKKKLLFSIDRAA
ncbi:MAG: MFS transporter [Pseudomonadota bacterium]|nr:MFS transporter [Pseudomonadota bacterium]